MDQTAERYHDISCGHRVVGHESKCAHLHGHNYRVHFTCIMDSESSPLDSIGRVIDFSVMKARLCAWLEEHWDHKFLAYEEDLVIRHMLATDDAGCRSSYQFILESSIVWVPFNPTAENIASYLLTVIGPKQLQGTGVKLTRVRVDETRKCSASASL